MYDVKNGPRCIIRCESGKLSKIIEWDSGSKVVLPITSTGEIKWFDDEKLLKDHN